MTLCEQCKGACCEELIVDLGPRDFFDDEFLRARLGPYITSTQRAVPGKPETLSVRLPLRCPKLTHDGLCSVHSTETDPTDQPTVCRLAPVRGPECLDALRRLRPELYDTLDENCACNETHTCEAHRA